jgi:hypothetical protein
VLLDFETRLRRLQRDIKIMLQCLSEEERSLVAANFAVVCDATINDEPLSLSNEDHLRQITADIRGFRADLIVIDTASAAFSTRDENSNSEVAARILKPLIRMARETQAAILIAHHVGKSGSEDGRSREQAYRGRGASAFGTFASLVVDLAQDTSDTSCVRLSLAKSKGKKFDDINLRLDKEKRWFSVTSQPASSTSPTPTSYDLVLDCFDDGRLRRRGELEQMLAGTVAKSTITDCLKRALKNGQIEMIKRGIYQGVKEMLVVLPPIGDQHN